MSNSNTTLFTYNNLLTLELSQLCDANYASLKNIVLTAPEEVQNKHSRLLRAVYKLLAIVLSIREDLQMGNNHESQNPLDRGDDARSLESLLAMSPEEIDQLAEENISQLLSMVQASLRADSSLEPREYDESDASSVSRLVIMWQLKATKAALDRRDFADGNATPLPPIALPEVSQPAMKRTNPLDATDDSGLGIKRQKVLRIAGVPTGEGDDDLQDFQYRLGGPAHIRPSQLGKYPGKTTVLLNVQELMGPSILYSFYQQGINIELVVRNVKWPRQSDGRPFSSEVEAVTLARCLHFHLCHFETMEEAIIKAPWTEIAFRMLWALLEVQTLTSGPSPLTREEAWQQVLPSLEVYPDVGIRVPAMRSVVNRQISAASRARNAVRSLTRKNQTQKPSNRRPHSENSGHKKEQ